MDIDRSFVDGTSGRTVLRDLVERRLSGSGRNEDDSNLLAPIATVAVELGFKPPADLRRLVVALHGQTVAGASFDFGGLNLNQGGDLQALLKGEGEGGAARRFAALHGAVPMGSLRTAGGAMPICWLPEPFAGFRKGRILGRGADGQVILVERVLTTFLMRLLEDHVAGANRYQTEPGEDWRSPAGWLDWALAAPAAAVNALDQGWFHALFPDRAIDGAVSDWGSGVPAQVCGLLWCWLSGDADGLARLARASQADDSLLVRQAALLGALDASRLIDAGSLAALPARLAAGRAALGAAAPPAVTRLRVADAAALPRLSLPPLGAAAPAGVSERAPPLPQPAGPETAPDDNEPATVGVIGAPAPGPLQAPAAPLALVDQLGDESAGDPLSEVEDRPLNLADTAAIDPLDAASPRSLPPLGGVSSARDRAPLSADQESIEDEYTDSGLWYAKNVDTHDAPLGYGDPQPAQALGLTAGAWFTLVGIAAVLVGIAAWMVQRT